MLEVYGYGEALSDHLDEFFKIYVEPIWEESTMFSHRERIRGNLFLNKLLHDNNHGLRLIYEKYKTENNIFTTESAKAIFSDLKHAEYAITADQIEEQFVLSLMTVADETMHSKLRKYEYLYYVEFLEMICRTALVGITMEDLIEYKVELLLEIVYDHQYRIKAMNPLDNPLMRVDEQFKHHKV